MELFHILVAPLCYLLQQYEIKMCGTLQGVHHRFILIEYFLRQFPDLSPGGNMQIPRVCVQYSLDVFSTLIYRCGKLVELFHILVAPLCYLLQQYEISI